MSVAVAATLLALTGCTAGSKAPATTSAPPTAASTTPTVPSTAPTTPASSTPAPSGPTVDPLTGGRVSRNPVVAVKIDDTANGRPQRNIDEADIVYVEEVEGGLTRLLAVFHTRLPVVEAVRSTRAADPEIARQYGPIAYVASGGQHNPVHLLERSPLKVSLEEHDGPGFARDDSRPVPYNLTADLAAVAHALKPAHARSIGLRWSASTAALAKTAPGAHVRTRVGSTDVAFDYDARARRYVRSVGGVAQRTAAGTLISTPNVVVQFCTVTPYRRDIDVNGNPNMFTRTVGSGRVVVFRDGKRITGTWHRSSPGRGTTLLDAAGKPIALRPGGAWVLLVHRDARLG